MKTRILQLGLFLFLGMTSLLSHSAIIYVDKFATGSNDGSTWSDAFIDLQDALDIAIPEDEIWVAAGVYKPSTADIQSDVFNMVNNVKLFGGFDGSETLKSQRDWNENLTILSGEIGNSTFESDNTNTLLNFSFVDDVVVDGFTIKKAWSSQYGNLYIENSNNIVFRHCIYKANKVTGSGSISIYLSNSEVEFSDCLFESNTANDLIANWFGASCDIINCTFSTNEVDRILFEGFGDIHCYNSIIYGNEIAESSQILEAQNCIFQEEISSLVSFDIYDIDPIYSDSDNGDFSLNYLSTAVNLGENSFNTNNQDLSHQTRISGVKIDLGCYEFQFNDLKLVDENATGTNTGNSWTNAYTTIEEAVNTISDNGTILVAAGVYYPTSTNSQLISLDLPSGVSLYGGFDGSEVNISQRNIPQNPTFISGNIGVPITNDDNSNILIKIQNNTEECKIDGFIIFGSNTGAAETVQERGAIYVIEADVRILNCEFTNNIHYANAIIKGHETDIYMENCLVHHNTSTSGFLITGGIAVNESNLTLTNITITDNIVNANSILLGAGSNQTLSLNNSIIWNGINNPIVHFSGIADAKSCILESGTTNFDTSNAIRTEYPDFVNPALFDYSITAASNAYDSGNNSFSTLPFDLAGNSRISDTKIDRGCYESLVCEQPHDLCVDAIELIVGASPTFGSNKCATNSPDEDSGCYANDGHSVWYTFTAPNTGTVDIKSIWIDKFSDTFNIRHILYEGSCGNLTELICDNDNIAGSGETTSTSDLIPGQIYYIRFDAFSEQEGRFTIQVTEIDPEVVPGVTYVNHLSTGLNDGSSWLNAYDDLQTALLNSQEGDLIWVAQGTYKPDVSDKLVAFFVGNNIGIYGGFLGNETMFSQRDYKNLETILSGEIGDQNSTSDNTQTIVKLGFNGVDATINGFTIQDANYDFDETNLLESACIMLASSNVINCIFKNNSSPFQSSILGIGNPSTPFGENFHIENCLFYDNISKTKDVFFIYGMEAQIINCTFTENTYTAEFSYGSVGTGFDELTSHTTIVNSIFYNNSISYPYNGIIDAYKCITEDQGFSYIGEEFITIADPLFSDPSIDDFSLSSASPAIDYGLNSYSTQSKDLAGEIRVQQTKIDAGCYESSFTTTFGCLDSEAYNYDSNAQTDDGSCSYEPPICLGDANGDGVVNITDLLAVSSFFGCQTGCTMGDANFDGVINITDFLAVSSFFGTVCP